MGVTISKEAGYRVGYNIPHLGKKKENKEKQPHQEVKYIKVF